jgi:hypothetical protein
MEWNCGFFTVDYEITDVSNQYMLKTIIMFVENSGKIHIIETSVKTITYNLSPKNNIFENLLDMYFGGIYSETNDKIIIDSLMYDGSPNQHTARMECNYIKNYIHHKGIIHNNIVVNLLPEFIEILFSLMNSIKDDMHKQIETTIDYKYIHELKELTELEYTRGINLINEFLII